MNLALPVPFHFFHHSFQNRTFWDNCTGFYGSDAIPVIHPTVSKHSSQHNALTPTSGLASSILNPPLAPDKMGTASFMPTF